MILLGKSLTAILGGGGETGASTFAALTDKATVDIPATNTPTATAINAREPSSNKKTDVDANKTSNTFFPTVKAVFDWVRGLFVEGAASSIDNAIARFDGTTGKLVQNSSVIIDDTGKVDLSGLQIRYRGDRITIATYGTISETVGGAAYITGNNIAASPTAASKLTKTSSTAGCQFIGMRYDRGIYFGTGIGSGDAVGTDYDDTVNERLRIALNGNIGINTPDPTAKLDVNGTSRFRDTATFNNQIIDNVGSSGTDGQVLKKVGGLVIWANP